ncbi:MAG: DUF445 domain-containing protein [Nocardioidaceae bacterium]
MSRLAEPTTHPVEGSDPLAGPNFGAADEARRVALRRMRLVAVGLLLLAAVVFIATVNRGGAWAYVHATAEAAMVGAIADWFAVSALFRHPLGLPIPHTAIIPTRKGALARSLQAFVTENFLSEAVIRQRLADAQVSRRLGGWLTEEVHSTRVVDEVSTVLRSGLKRIHDDEVAAIIETEIIPRLVDEPLSELSGRLLGEVVEEGAHHGLVDLALVEAHRWLSSNTEQVAAVLSTRAPWWTPQWLDEKVTERLQLEALAWIADIRDDPDHDARRAFDDLLRQFSADLQHDPSTIERAERLKQRVLSQPQVVVTAVSLWGALRRALLETLDDPHSPLRARGIAQLQTLGKRLVDDSAFSARVDGYAAEAAVYAVSRYGAEVTTVITDTIDRWDGKEAANRIELHVGRDLQFIRINGTLVGGLAGLLIYALSKLL